MKSESNESLYCCVKLVRCRRRVSAGKRTSVRSAAQNAYCELPEVLTLILLLEPKMAA